MIFKYILNMRHKFFLLHGKIRFFINAIFSLFILDSVDKNFKKVDVLFLCSDMDRALIKNGLLYSQILDPLVEMCANSGISYECVTRPFSRFKTEGLFSRSKTINWSYAFYRKSFWRFFLDNKVAPRVIVGIGICHRLNRLARLRGIVTVELIHGFGLAKDDYIYGVSARKSRDCLMEPRCYITYDETTFGTLKGVSFDNGLVDVKLARHHFYDRSDLWNFDILSSTQKTISKYKSVGYKFVVLVTLQHGYEGSRDFLKNIIPNGIIHPLLTECIKERTDFLWIIKPHPVQLMRSDWRKTYRILCREFSGCHHVLIDDFISADIFAIFHFVDAHITMMSGSVVEAAMLKVPSLGLCPSLQGSMNTAFEVEEQQGLFIRGHLTRSSIFDFLDEVQKKMACNINHCFSLYKNKSAFCYLEEYL